MDVYFPLVIFVLIFPYGSPQQTGQEQPNILDLSQLPVSGHQSAWTQQEDARSNENLTPVDLNICSDANYRLVDTLPGLRRSTEVRTLQLGQSGVIWPMSNRSVPFNADCNLQLSACSACLILISWNTPSNDVRSVLPIPEQRQISGLDNDKRITSCESIWDFRDRPRCVDLRLIEADADQATLKPYQRVSLLNPPPEYKIQFISSSYKLDINMQFWRGDGDIANTVRQLFPLKYTVIDNTRAIKGRPSSGDLPTNYSDGFIASPRFPKTYPEGVTVNYTLINEDPEGAIRLIFTDFRVHYMSILKIIDSNGQEIANTQSQYGTSQRPAALQSSGQILTIVFTANNYKHDIGFRANYRFVKEKFWLDQPSAKSCDKVYEDPGGVITIENLNLDAYTYVDCIWILEKPRYAPIGFDKLYMKVEDFSVLSSGKGIQLDLHAGRTSTNRRLLSIFGPKSSELLTREQPQEGFISDSIMQASSDKSATTTLDEDDSDTGFYLRLRGYLGSSTGLDVAFAQFYRWATAICHDPNEFHCDNGRCISNRYQCDNHDQCGDYSDEIKCQNRKSEHGAKGKSGPYAGPGSDQDSDSPVFPLGGYTTTILLVAGLIGLTLVLLMVTVIVARVYRQKLMRRFAAVNAANPGGDGGDQSEIGSALNRSVVVPMDEQLGSRPAPSLHQVGNRRLLVLPESEIGVLEAPPTYDDAMKHPTVPPSNAATLLRSSQQLFNQTPIIASTSIAPAISTAPSSSNELSTSFDNPAFESEPAETGQRSTAHRSRHRGRRRVRSNDSTTSTSSSGSEDGETSGSCTGSELETASDGDVMNGKNGPSTAESMVDNGQNTGEIQMVPIENEHAKVTALRKPPVPLPRSSRMSRPNSVSTQGHLNTVTGTDLNASNWTQMNDTLV